MWERRLKTKNAQLQKNLMLNFTMAANVLTLKRPHLPALDLGPVRECVCISVYFSFILSKSQYVYATLVNVRAHVFN